MEVAEGRQPRAEPWEQAERDQGKCQPGDTRGVVLGDSLKEETGPFRREKLLSDFATKKSLENLASPFSEEWFRWKPNS